MSPLITVPTPHPSVQIAYDFITPQEEVYLLQKVQAVGDSKTTGGWTELNGRRSMYWGGTLAPSGALIASAFPSFMDGSWPDVLGKIRQTGAFEALGADSQGKGKGPNHCLVNEYLPGQGIHAHTDGPAYCPLVATLSLGSHTILTLTPPSDSTSMSTSSSHPADGDTSPPSPTPPSPTTILLPPRSLIVLSADVYSTYMHGIEKDVKLDSMEALRACANWESYWEAGGGLTLSSDAGGDVDGVESSGMDREKLIAEVVARRRMAEAGKGWERGTRVSLTCRMVEKVRRGIKLG